MSRWSRKLRAALGLKRRSRENRLPRGYAQRDKAVHAEVAPYTMTDSMRILSLIRAVEYSVEHDIPGAFVECGVWKGGCMMAVARTLLNLGVNDRELYLFDTFSGMTAPTDRDLAHDNVPASATFERKKFEGQVGSDWCFSPIDEVRRNVASVGYPMQLVHFVEGKVEDTLADNRIDKIALLRLDTDFYESTLAEFEYLYPSVASGGVVILDDYYTWQGSKTAADEYLARIGERIFLAPTGGGGAVLGIKP